MISFYKFLEQQEEEEQNSKSSYISALEDDLGINPEDIAKDPKYASFFSLGGRNGINMGTYKVIEFKRNQDGDITHAVVVKNDDKAIKNKTFYVADKEIIQIPKDIGKKTFLIPIEDLEGLMNQGSTPQQPAGSGLEGML